MGKRQKAELLGLVQQIVRMYNDEKMTLEDIEKKLKAEGYDISREAIRRTVKSNKQIAADLTKAQLEAQELLKATRENPNVDTQELILQFLSSKIFESIKSIDDFKFDSAGDIVRAASMIAQSQTQIAKFRMSFANGAEKAKAAIYDELAMVLNDRPELLVQLQEVIARIEVKA